MEAHASLHLFELVRENFLDDPGFSMYVSRTRKRTLAWKTMDSRVSKACMDTQQAAAVKYIKKGEQMIKGG